MTNPKPPQNSGDHDDTGGSRDRDLGWMLPEVTEPLTKTPYGYVEWYRRLAQRSDEEISKHTAQLYEYGKETLDKTLGLLKTAREGQQVAEDELYYQGDHGQSFLLDAANMLMEAGFYGHEPEDSYRSAFKALDILIDPREEPSVVLNAAIYTGDLGFLETIRPGSTNKEDWLTFQQFALVQFLEAINICKKMSTDSPRLPAGVINEAYNLFAARQALMLGQIEGRTTDDTLYRASYLREDRAHRPDDQTGKYNFDLVRMDKVGQGWKTSRRWQLGLDIVKVEHEDTGVEVAVHSLDDGQTEWAYVDRAVEVLRSFASTIDYMVATESNESYYGRKPTKRERRLADEAISVVADELKLGLS